MTRYAYPIGAFCIEALPNQPQLAHCHSFFVPANMRGRGHAQQLKQLQCEALREQAFDFATCTTAGDNVRQHRVLERAGWMRLATFPNQISGGTTILWGWQVTKEASHGELPAGA